MESEDAESIYSGLRYNSDFYLTSRMNAAEDGLQWIGTKAYKNCGRAGHCKAIDAILARKDRPAARERARSPLYDV